MRRACCLAALVLLFVSLPGCNPFGAGPGRVVQRFYQAVADGEIDAAIEHLSANTVSTVGREKIRKVLAQQTREIKSKGGLEEIKVLAEEITGELAEVEVRLTFGGGGTDDEDVNLLKEDGKWKIEFSK